MRWIPPAAAHALALTAHALAYAALRAVAVGYGKVYWYRGGIEAWTAAGLPTARTPVRR